MNPIARDLNEDLRQGNPYLYDMLSQVGKKLFFPKGILSQSAEAKEKAHKFNATAGMATEKGKPMHLGPMMAPIQGLQTGEALTYAPSFGIAPLREAWRESLFRKNPSLQGKKLSLPVVTNAITHGLSVVSDMWVDPGDVILLPDKMWGNYQLIFCVRRGGEIVQYPLFNSRGKFHFEAFKKCALEQAEGRDKLIFVLNFPNNPTGYTVSPLEADAIADFLAQLATRGTHVLAVIDDAYFGLFYDEDTLKESLFGRVLDRNPRLLAIKVDGATKEDYAWGLRVGFITYGVPSDGDPDAVYNALEKKTAGAVRGSISNASHLSQSILLKAMGSEAYLKEKEQKRALMTARAKEVKRVLLEPKFREVWEPYPFNSGYFMCLKLKTVKAEPLRIHLLDRYGVGLISLGETDLRVAFSCIEEKDIPELFEIIFRAIKDLEP